MPYDIKKKSCKKSNGKKGKYTLSYVDKSGKRRASCHSTEKKAKDSISAIEASKSENIELIRNLIIELISL